MIEVAAVFSRVQTVLTDAGYRRFPAAELRQWLADGWREIIIYKPEAASVTAEMAVAANTVRQAVPTGYLRLLDIISSNGAAVTAQTRQQMDVADRSWRTRQGSNIRHFVLDVSNPREFEIYPVPTTALATVAVLVPDPPQTIAEATTTIPLDSTCMSPLVDFICYRALLKDSADTFNAQRAAMHYQAYAAAMGLKVQNLVVPRPGEK